MSRMVCIVLVLLGTLCACAPARTADVPSAQADTAVRRLSTQLAASELPVADPTSSARALGRGAGATVAHARDTVGASERFRLYDSDHRTSTEITAHVLRLSDHSVWWVADGVAVAAEDLRAAADRFDDEIYPRAYDAYASQALRSAGGVRVHVLIAPLPGRIAGTFDPANAYPQWVNPTSAERMLIYLNVSAAPPASSAAGGVLAHEFCHLLQFGQPRFSAAWFAEGHAQVCERQSGFGTGFEQAYLRAPDVQLTSWPTERGGVLLNYGASFLFVEFLREHAGGDALIAALLAHGVQTTSDIDAVLRARGQPGVLDQLARFVAANALVGRAPADLSYGSEVHVLAPAQPVPTDALRPDADALERTTHEFGVRYFGLPAGTWTLALDAPATAATVPVRPHSGGSFWWSDRGDGVAPTLTRGLDLRGVRTATLRFWSWYDLEPGFDYAYLSVSTDGGSNWENVATQQSATDDPHGRNLGSGITGHSGEAWNEQQADLTAFAGRDILVRFTVMTDLAVNGAGFALDDLTIPELGLRDDAEGAGAWMPQGFVRGGSEVLQRFLVVLVSPNQPPQAHVVDGGRTKVELIASVGDVVGIMPIAERSTSSVRYRVALHPNTR